MLPAVTLRKVLEEQTNLLNNVQYVTKYERS